ncbi:SGNH/GDSL hydrolase family protein [Jiangella asiatica]|uniref:GDSL family lipase n=1 Tax=Jiangella asiatica TaxID=2530372 RepID=A0A4R5DHE1_9ACTN|nr:SGNH/GDSL hydrolase family protein [Jiangella asiatica]TDE09903.1 GDSL family lipase [Jiangella asiatica]
MGFLLQPGQTVVFAGDSITDAGRTLDLGIVGETPLGEGYVRDVVGLIDARYPGHGLAVHNTGIGGITTAELTHLWDEHVLAREPDWVTILIGINDCHRTLYEDGRAVPPATYEANLRDILDRTRAAGASVVLLDPFYMWLPADRGDQPGQVLEFLGAYHQVVHRLVAEYGTLHVRTHDVFQEQLAHRPLPEIGVEPVHPTPSGHLVIAHALLDVLRW